VASTPAEAGEIAATLEGGAVVKAQVHAGGRGKAGGIKVVSSASEAEEAAGSLLGTHLVTAQTGPQGVPVRRVLVEELLDVERELYLGMLVDGAALGAVAIASESGGMEIEDVAERTPEKILRLPIDPMLGLHPYQGRRLAYELNVAPEQVRAVSGLIEALYRVFDGYDCSLAEINPLVVTRDGRVVAADAKLSFDDDALFKHPDLADLRDPEQDDPLEEQARRAGISYVKLDGDVGCMVNGAGLAMATMDVASAAGTAPANFLDVGGSADEQKVICAMEIILSDPSVNTILINIFGGILRCDVVARGVLAAAESTSRVMKPLVVRMSGTNADEGRRLLEVSDLAMTLVDDLDEAAEAIRATA
jgi:succinyl-CoA synthetase beta subunit